MSLSKNQPERVPEIVKITTPSDIESNVKISNMLKRKIEEIPEGGGGAPVTPRAKR